MSKKTAASQLPKPDYSADNGIAIGDYFSYEAPQGEGLLDSHILMDSLRSTLNIPEGLLPKFANNPHNPEDQFSSIAIDHALTAPPPEITHFDWLDMSEFEGMTSPDYPTDYFGRRLPKPSNRLMLEELHEQWGASTDGVFKRVHATALPSQSPSAVSDYTWDTLTRMAKRSLEAGKPMQEITETFRKMARGYQASDIKAFTEYLDGERGLAGRVYVEAANYPNLISGANKDYFQRKFANVRYLIAEANSPIASQFKTFWGKVVTESVPWDEAYDYYAPRLMKSGYKVASGDPRTTLRAAFLSTPVKDVAPTHFQMDHSPKVTYEEAEQALRKAKADPRLKSTWERDLKLARKATLENYLKEETSRMITAGYLGKEDLNKIGSFKTVEELWDYAKNRVQNNLVQAALYSGPILKSANMGALNTAPNVNVDVKAHGIRMANQALKAAVSAGFISDKESQKIAAFPADRWIEAITKVASLRATRLLAKKIVPVDVAKYAGEGLTLRDHIGINADVGARDKAKHEHLISREAAVVNSQIQHLAKTSLSETEFQRVLKATSDPKRQLALAKKIAALKQHRAQAIPESGPAQDYSGGYNIQAAHQTAVSDDHINQKRASEQKPLVLAQVRHWMNQGLFGKALSQKIASRYEPLLSYLREEILAVRKAHEGAAGFEYVDAGAYADLRGPKGCEVAAGMRTAAKTVLACGSCTSCPMASGGSCKRFNMPLTASVDVPMSVRKANVTKKAESASAPVFRDTLGLSAPSVEISFAKAARTHVIIKGNVYE